MVYHVCDRTLGGECVLAGFFTEAMLFRFWGKNRRISSKGRENSFGKTVRKSRLLLVWVCLGIKQTSLSGKFTCCGTILAEGMIEWKMTGE